MMEIMDQVFLDHKCRTNGDGITQGKQKVRPGWDVQDLVFKHLDVGPVFVGDAKDIDKGGKEKHQPSVVGILVFGTIKFSQVCCRICAEINRIHNPKRFLPPDGFIPVAIECLVVRLADWDFFKLAFDNGSVHHHHDG
jgi:hypothetical protein